MRVTIVGAGLSGISQAIQIRRQLGDRVDLTIIECDDDIGGIWLNSTWPGAGVDLPIHLYSIYTDPQSWTNVFATQADMWTYLKSCVARYDLDKDIRLNTTYLSSDWDGTSQTHTLTLKSHDDTYQHVTDVLISANGPLSRPLLPNIPGRDTFKGIAIHNLNWRKHDIDFTGMRIAVIGNGSSGIQLLPGLAEIPGVSITQYVRSGGYYYPKVNTPFHAWQRFALDWVPGFRFCYRSVLFRRQHDRSQARGRQNAAGHAEEEKMLLAYLEKNAPAEYLDALRPAYPLGCKRPAFDAGWLAALHRSNVTLNGQGIREITEDSIIDNAGAIAPVDIIIFATGADVGRHGVGLNENLHGEDGVELKAYWQSLGGPQAYRGLSVPKFPNYFITIGPNAAASSWAFTIGNQTTVIARIIAEMVKYGIGSLQPKHEVFAQHNEEIQEALAGSTMNSDKCTNWWKMDRTGRNTVSNSLSAVGLWWATRTTHWDDWEARDKQNKAIDVQKLTRRESLLRVTVGLSAIAILGVGLRWGKIA